MATVQNNTISSDLLATMNPSAKSAASTAEAAQDKFMTLLVTQMRNQDPLNPMDNAQVTSQLAQLSTVTGIDKVNATLESMMGSFQTNQAVQAAGMIGHGVFAPGNNVTLASGKALFGIELADPADKVQVTIRNASGVAVHSMDLGSLESGVHPFTWDGKTDSGATADDGNYTMEITAMRGGQKSVATALAFGQVASVASGAQGVKLSVTGIGDIGLADVRQIL